MNTGARGLQTLMSEIQNEMLLELIMEEFDKEDTVMLTEDLLEKPKKHRIRTI